MTDTILTFRHAMHADIPAIVALVESAYRGDASRIGWTTEADMLDGQRIDPESLARDIDADNSRVLLAERDGELLACCHLQKNDVAAYFGMFSVRPTLQGGGVGKLLLAEGERQAREEWRCLRMEMTVIDIRDTLIAFYERRGYHRTGVHKPFPYGDERYGLPKRDDLRFEILEKSLA
ncbi:MAG TPA: GNAT family N-acetyltransferase [Arenimonas sp.]|uniref:GNAT family N-acetyltransferase n=1 Tax=Arenimonas sp. TaxID=1872635 RepID=UPI002BC1C8C0|nr:GNAT family N-acetyltransferase [Arenimonas sp.]HMB55904.1 GNAT family N-acetyltransferase [Arenimonas sp.]